MTDPCPAPVVSSPQLRPADRCRARRWQRRRDRPADRLAFIACDGNAVLLTLDLISWQITTRTRRAGPHVLAYGPSGGPRPGIGLGLVTNVMDHAESRVLRRGSPTQACIEATAPTRRATRFHSLVSARFRSLLPSDLASERHPRGLASTLLRV